MIADIKKRAIVKETEGAAVDSFSRATLISLSVVSGLIGLWAVACIVGALVTNGPLAVSQGFISALF